MGQAVLGDGRVSTGVPSETRQRLDWVDATKGLAIILVVFGHAWRGIHLRGLVSEPLFQAVDSRIYAFHMPVFFAVSGLFLTDAVSRMTPRGFVESRFVRMVWPLTLWTYLFLAAKLLAGDLAKPSDSGCGSGSSPNSWILTSMVPLGALRVAHGDLGDASADSEWTIPEPHFGCTSDPFGSLGAGAAANSSCILGWKRV